MQRKQNPEEKKTTQLNTNTAFPQHISEVREATEIPLTPNCV